ncbi:hypothetical protein HYR69_02285 [Candidatus Sumerlaeota bacterium]|nr:hypothetical protein [Candidatus Sumerlaeota bacterium]
MIRPFVRLFIVVAVACVVMAVSPLYDNLHLLLAVIGFLFAALAAGAITPLAGIAVLIAGVVFEGMILWSQWELGNLVLDRNYTLPVAVGICALGLYFLLRALADRREERLILAAEAQAAHLDTFAGKRLGFAIFISAALSLYLELAVIRWQTTVLEFFAFYKNFSMLACFAGLGLGYALADRRQIPLLLTLPLIGFQILFFQCLRFGPLSGKIVPLMSSPITEQLNMGWGTVKAANQFSEVYLLLAISFGLTALAFIPLGQLCGRLMRRAENLAGYGWNLLGSAAGVASVFALSYFWTPPVVWFAAAFIPLLAFQTFSTRGLLWGTGFALFALAVLAWPVSTLNERIYSPYQLIERGQGANGLMELRAAGHYYQRVHNLALSNANRAVNPALDAIGRYYEFPYRVHGKPERVAIVGAGTGNDVSAALRMGAREVDAVEIDPVILTLGKAYHPEKPYNDPRVNAIVNDARAFFKTTNRTYDLIAYGLLDSHSLLSHASSVRLDSFVYTVEGLREARAHLRPGGLMSLSFCVINSNLGKKIFSMMQQVFDGHPPVCVRTDYDMSVIFLEREGGEVRLTPDLLQGEGFADTTQILSRNDFQADVSTDDWPFFYMPARVYPVSYLGVLGLIAVLSVLFFRNFVSQPVRVSEVPFLLMGAGFMLVETKGITEAGLLFGNTWQVIGIVIIGILIMAFLANGAVAWLRAEKPWIPFAFLIASLAAGFAVSKWGGFAPTLAGRAASVAALTCPMFFSGIIFSALLRSSPDISGVMASNLLGAMLGGLLEYNSMYFGFRFLYILAAGIYALAWWSAWRVSKSKRTAEISGKICHSPATQPPLE